MDMKVKGDAIGGHVAHFGGDDRRQRYQGQFGLVGTLDWVDRGIPSLTDTLESPPECLEYT